MHMQAVGRMLPAAGTVQLLFAQPLLRMLPSHTGYGNGTGTG